MRRIKISKKRTTKKRAAAIMDLASKRLEKVEAASQAKRDKLDAKLKKQKEEYYVKFAKVNAEEAAKREKIRKIARERLSKKK